MEVNRKLLAIIVIVIVAAALGYYYFMQRGEAIEAKAESGDSSTSVVARPYIDYKTEDGRILRVYLDDGSKWWVNPDGTLTPYTGYVWTVPGTLTKITQVQVGFELTLSGKYLKDTDGDGKQDITVFVTAYFKSNGTGTGQYSVFSNTRFDYEVGTPSAGGSTTQTIQSGYKDIQTIFDNVWGGSPGQDYIYWPYYYVSISVNATSYWGGSLQASDSKEYSHTVIGDWQWKQSELSASLGGASAGTQSIIGIEAVVQDPFAVLMVIAVAMLVGVLFSDKLRRSA